MRAGLFKTEKTMEILCEDGTIISEPSDGDLYYILTSFKEIEKLTGDSEKRWDKEYSEMEDYSGKLLAFVNEADELIIWDFNPFKHLLKNQNEEKLLSVSEYAIRAGKSQAIVRRYCANGKFPGAIKISLTNNKDGVWMIPDVPWPSDERKVANKKYKRREHNPKIPKVQLEKGMITAQEYAVKIGKGIQTVVKACKNGKIPGAMHVPAKKGLNRGYWMIPEENVDWLEKCKNN